MDVDLERPRDGEKDEYPEIVRAQASTKGLPHANRKVWGDEISRDMIGPFLVRRNGPVRQHRGEITGFENTHTIRPHLVVAIAPCLHKEEDRDEDRVDRDREVRIVGRAKDE